MNQDRRADTGLDRLLGELVDWLAKPLASFLRIEAAGGAILLVVTIAALVLSNSPWADQFLTFGDNHLNAAKLGILSASVVSAVLGFALLAWLSSSRRMGRVEDRRQHDASNSRPFDAIRKSKTGTFWAKSTTRREGAPSEKAFGLDR